MNYLDFTLRITIWLLLTADLSIGNVVLGLIISAILPHSKVRPGQAKQWFMAAIKVVMAVPQAYIEAIEMMIFPHRFEDITIERVDPDRSPGLRFVDIFVITFTPKTIVIQYHDQGFYEIHRVTRRKKP